MCRARTVVPTLVAALCAVGWLLTSSGGVRAAATAGRRTAPAGQYLTTAAFAGDPILTYSGGYWRLDRDLGPERSNLLLSFTRAYYSVMPADYGFGIGWSSNYGERLVPCGGNRPAVYFTLCLVGAGGVA